MGGIANGHFQVRKLNCIANKLCDLYVFEYKQNQVKEDSYE